jgi:predicted MPP superfamily phosphohydrolase
VGTHFWRTLLLGAAAGLTIKAYLESGTLTVTRETVAIPGLPAPFRGFRLLQLSDLHLGRAPAMAERVLACIAAEKPDLLCFTGDYALTNPALPSVAAFLRAAAALAPALAVYGNADYRRRMPDGAREAWALHVPFLVNDARPVTRGGAQLWFAGVDDPHLGGDDLPRALRDVPPDVPVVLLAHSAEIITRPLDPRVRLILAGHTHGGQVCLPTGKAIYANSALPVRFASGRHALDGAVLYVSRGIGSTRLPLRLWCPPEAVVFTLVSGGK